MAQLIDSPTTFHIQPMQIDTKNRHYNGSDFKPDLLPKASAAPEGAPYSGLLECPCTDRIVKKVEVEYSTQSQGACATTVASNTECFAAADKVIRGTMLKLYSNVYLRLKMAKWMGIAQCPPPRSLRIVRW